MSIVPMAIGQVAAGRARAEAASVLLRGERALYVEGCLATARGLFSHAHALAEEAGDGLLTAEGALGLGGLWVHEHRPSTEAAHVEARQRAALAALDPRSILALRLRTRLVTEADYRAGRHTTHEPCMRSRRR